eukprot:SAG11_NODE_13460_length_654_cov_1.327928_1_plen_83_part_00
MPNCVMRRIRRPVQVSGQYACLLLENTDSDTHKRTKFSTPNFMMRRIRLLVLVSGQYVCTLFGILLVNARYTNTGKLDYKTV